MVFPVKMKVYVICTFLISNYNKNIIFSHNNHCRVIAIRNVLDRGKWADRGTLKYRNLFMVITLNVRNVFNSASYIYIYIEQAIRERQIPKYLADLLGSFLSQRCILVEEIDESVQNSRQMTCGVPQGSVFEPIL